MFAEPKFLSLPGGQLAYDEYGDPAGRPVFFFHGWPASRLQGAGFHPEAVELGVRIIAPDRPGIGLSTLIPDRRLLDWPAMVAELARELKVEKFRVLAVSGGGPYALVTSWAMPQAVEAAAVVSGAPPLADRVAAEDLMSVYRALLAIRRRFPNFLRTLFKIYGPFATLRPPLALVSRLLKVIAPSDHGALVNPETYAGAHATYREAWRGSPLGVAMDGEIYGEPWGFAPEEIRVPVTVWHGTDDRSFGWKLAQALAGRIPGSQQRFMEGEGHYSLPIRHGRAILEELMRSQQPT